VKCAQGRPNAVKSNIAAFVAGLPEFYLGAYSYFRCAEYRTKLPAAPANVRERKPDS
jgi:hypothetical protein